jgi:hypothetical protein
MRLPPRDWFATAVVGLALAIAGLWATDAAVPGLESLRATGVVVLACGFVASAGAVVPGFEQLIRGDRMYLMSSSLLGVVALVAGIMLLVTDDAVWLAVLAATTFVLWAMATLRHVRAAARQHHPTARIARPGRHHPAAA